MKINNEVQGFGKKIICPVCSGIHCLEEILPENEGNSWMCLECGFNSSSKHTIGSDIVMQIIQTSPKLMNDVQFLDEERGILWFPSIVQLGAGIVFPEGTVEDWNWKFVPSVEIPEEERENYRAADGKLYERRLAMELGEEFPRDKFYKALEKMGAILPMQDI